MSMSISALASNTECTHPVLSPHAAGFESSVANGATASSYSSSSENFSWYLSPILVLCVSSTRMVHSSASCSGSIPMAESSSDLRVSDVSVYFYDGDDSLEVCILLKANALNITFPSLTAGRPSNETSFFILRRCDLVLGAHSVIKSTEIPSMYSLASNFPRLMTEKLSTITSYSSPSFASMSDDRRNVVGQLSVQPFDHRAIH